MKGILAIDENPKKLEGRLRQAKIFTNSHTL